MRDSSSLVSHGRHRLDGNRQAMSWMLSLLIVASFALSAQDIGADAFDRADAVWQDSATDSPARRLAESHTQYACGMLALHEDGRFSSRAEAHFLAALAHDPNSLEILKTLFSGWSGPDGVRAEMVIEKARPIAVANPSAWRLNAAVAEALLQLDREEEALALLEAALREVERHPEKAVAENSGGTEVIAMTASVMGMTERYDDGEKMFRRLLRRQPFARNFAIRRAAVSFFDLTADDEGGDGWWLFPSRKQRFRRAFDEHLAATVELWRKVALMAWERRQPVPVLDLAPLLQVCRRNELFMQGEDMILQARLTDPDDLRAALFHAAFLADSERYAEAVRLWRMIIAGRPDDADFHFEAGRMALLAGWHEEAAREFDAYLLLRPGEPPALYQAAIAHYELGNHDKAIYLLEQVSELPMAYQLKALAHRRESRYQQAMAAMAEAEAAAKKLARDEFLSRDFRLTFAYMCERAGDIARASTLLEGLHQENPQDAEIANFLGYLWADHNQRLDEAERLVRIALADDPDNAAYLDSLAWVFFRQGRFTEAAREIERSLAEDGELPDAVIADHAGDIYLAVGDVSRALAFWRMAVDRHNDDLDHQQVREKIARHEPQ